jgi:hypothetical protein
MASTCTTSPRGMWRLSVTERPVALPPLLEGQASCSASRTKSNSSKPSLTRPSYSAAWLAIGTHATTTGNLPSNFALPSCGSQQAKCDSCLRLAVSLASFIDFAPDHLTSRRVILGAEGSRARKASRPASVILYSTDPDLRGSTQPLPIILAKVISPCVGNSARAGFQLPESKFCSACRSWIYGRDGSLAGMFLSLSMHPLSVAFQRQQRRRINAPGCRSVP